MDPAPESNCGRPSIPPASVETSLDGVIDALAERGWCVAQGLLEPRVLEGLASDAQRQFEHQDFHPASIGQHAQQRIDKQLRSDRIQWLDQASPSIAQSAFREFIDTLRTRLNRELYLGVQEFEAQFSAYPPGAFYSRHLDRFHRDDARTLTCIAYLNREWRGDDGGQLRLYLDDGSAVDVQPELGTLVIFLSERFFHEVLPAKRLRFAVSGWFRRFNPLR